MDGPLPISLLEIKYYIEIFGALDDDVAFVNAIMSMDHVWLEHSYKARPVPENVDADH